MLQVDLLLATNHSIVSLRGNSKSLRHHHHRRQSIQNIRTCEPNEVKLCSTAAGRHKYFQKAIFSKVSSVCKLPLALPLAPLLSYPTYNLDPTKNLNCFARNKQLSKQASHDSITKQLVSSLLKVA